MAPFGVTAILAFLWVCITVLIARVNTHAEGQAVDGLTDYNCDKLQRTALAIIINTVICVLTVSFVLPIGLRIDTTGATQWIHHVGVVLLGTFLVVALFFQLDIWMKRQRQAGVESLQDSYRNWRTATELMPAPAAIMIVLSGMGRIYAKPGFSIGRGWIFTLILVLAVMMSDGIFGYTVDLRRLLQLADVAVRDRSPLSAFVTSSRRIGNETKLLLHSLSFPFVVVFPAFKISDASSPATPLLRRFAIEDSGGWPQLWPAMVLFTVPFLFVASLNRFGRSELSRDVTVPRQSVP